MPKINLFKKLSLIFLSSILFVNSMVMPFAVAKAADEEPSTWYNQGFTTSKGRSQKATTESRGGFTDWYAKVYGDEPPHLKFLYNIP